ncbi:class I SAM-dependent methyltransferase [Brevibacterium yomogidense]|uniref:class I SAM-dependent methyltransferase n=1 Tax=Brevibacterium yomogidense TaxID=946573 RepID=UPI0018E05EF6|nr:methyltransferase [Brevibacterium yomogidense]
MLSSLLSEYSSVLEGPWAEADTVLTRWSSDWPRGHANARIVEEYLLGRAMGLLDVSGRPVVAGPASGAPAPVSPPTAVLGDPEGGLVLAAVLTGAPSVAVAGDSAAATAACREAVEVLPATLRDAVRFCDSPAEAVAALAEAPSRTVGEGGEAPGLRVIIDSPKQFAVLREYLRVVGRQASEVVVVGREKHMSPRMNRLLGETHADVHVSPGRAKSRILVASGLKKRAADSSAGSAGRSPQVPAQATATSPAEAVPEIRVSAFAGTFGGASVDPGARLLVRAVAHRYAGHAGEGMRVLDLGCGNGWLLAALGALLPKANLHGVDDSQAAVDSTALTVASVRPGEDPAALAQLDGTTPLPWRTSSGGSRGTAPRDFVAGSFDLVTLNPPFHEGATVTTETAHALIRNAAELVAPGGRLVVVHNSHLRYRSHLQHRLIDVEQWARDRRFTVLTGTAPAA